MREDDDNGIVSKAKLAVEFKTGEGVVWYACD